MSAFAVRSIAGLGCWRTIPLVFEYFSVAVHLLDHAIFERRPRPWVVRALARRVLKATNPVPVLRAAAAHYPFPPK